MPEEADLEQIAALESKIKYLAAQLEEAKEIVRKWVDASAQLSLSASEARAKNQGAGSGLGGMILGAKYRASMRRAAAASNAAIARDVAKKRATIAEEKGKAQELVRAIQAELKETKEQYKSLVALAKSKDKGKGATVKSTSDSVGLLKKLKEAHDLGLLTDEEYEEKRKKIASNI